MNLEQFNRANRDDAMAAIRPCMDIERWIAGVVDGRPYAGANALLEQARTAANPLQPAEIDAALAHHPRIGERAAGNGAEASMSSAEQAGLGDSSTELEQALAQGNRDYEARFDRVFLIRAAGRDRQEVLAELRRRMGNDNATELQEVGAQLREIALLRLQEVVHA